jgi:hypothetical protein
MAMAKPVVMTSMGQEGIAMSTEQSVLVVDEPNEMALQVNKLLSTSDLDYSSNRQWIMQRYSWDGALQKLPELLEGNKSGDKKENNS